MNANQKVCPFVVVGGLGMACYIEHCLLFIFLEGDEMEMLRDRMEHCLPESETAITKRMKVEYLKLVWCQCCLSCVHTHSLIQLQIHCFLIHMLACKVKTSHKSHMYCLMSFFKLSLFCCASGSFYQYRNW